MVKKLKDIKKTQIKFLEVKNKMHKMQNTQDVGSTDMILEKKIVNLKT